jgi:hypothetical protein
MRAENAHIFLCRAADPRALSESMSTKDHCTVLTGSTAALILAIVFQVDSSRADDRSQGYLNDMRIMACVIAENAVRARLKHQGPVSFESCASSTFDIDLAADDRDYKVSGYATVLSPGAGSARRRFFVGINHNPASYSDWGFEVTKIEIEP